MLRIPIVIVPSLFFFAKHLVEVSKIGEVFPFPLLLLLLDSCGNFHAPFVHRAEEKGEIPMI